MVSFARGGCHRHVDTLVDHSCRGGCCLHLDGLSRACWSCCVRLGWSTSLWNHLLSLRLRWTCPSHHHSLISLLLRLSLRQFCLRALHLAEETTSSEVRECRHHVVAKVNPFLWWARVPQLWLVWLRVRFLAAGAPARPRVRVGPSWGAAYPAFDANLTRQQERPAATKCAWVATLCFFGAPTLPTQRHPACVAPAQARLEAWPRDQRSTSRLQAPTT